MTEIVVIAAGGSGQRSKFLQWGPGWRIMGACSQCGVFLGSKDGFSCRIIRGNINAD